MPNKGDTYTVMLSETHLGWGNHRYTDTRDIIYDEGYIKIPSDYAKQFKIYNSNYGEGVGINEFQAFDAKGEYIGLLKSAGNNKAGDIYAKNLHGSGDLKLLGKWFTSQSVVVGDSVRVTWISSTELILEII